MGVEDLDKGNNNSGLTNLYFQTSETHLQWRASESDSWTNGILLSELGGSSTASIQPITISEESAGSVDMGDGAWLDINCDEDGSLSIIDTSTMVTGVLYKLQMFNSDVAVVTITIPTGWISNTLGASIPLDPSEYSSALAWKDDAGDIHISAGFSLEVA